jgi:hypothetical protein
MSKYQLSIQLNTNLFIQHLPHTFVKLSGFMATAVPMIKDMYPNSKLLFNTRGYRKSFASNVSVFDGLSTMARWLGTVNEVLKLIYVKTPQIMISHLFQFIYYHSAIPFNNHVWSEWHKELSSELGRLGAESSFNTLSYCGQVPKYGFVFLRCHTHPLTLVT